MKAARRTLATILICLPMMTLGACADSEVPAGYRGIDTRTQAAEAVASGVIASAAARASADLEYYLPGDEFAELRSDLLSSVPETLPADPLRYGAVFDSNPETVDEVTATVTPDDGSRGFGVGLRWDDAASRSVWRNGDYVDTPGNWAVVSVESLNP